MAASSPASTRPSTMHEIEPTATYGAVYSSEDTRMSPLHAFFSESVAKGDHDAVKAALIMSHPLITGAQGRPSTWASPHLLVSDSDRTVVSPRRVKPERDPTPELDRLSGIKSK